MELIGKSGSGLMTLYKIEVYLLKILPLLMAGLYFLNTVLSYLNLDYEVISYLAGVGIIPLLFLYISSYCFKFCSYHRMPLHYIVANDIVCWVDGNWPLPVDDLEYLSLHCVVAFVCIVVGVRMKVASSKPFPKGRAHKGTQR